MHNTENMETRGLILSRSGPCRASPVHRIGGSATATAQACAATSMLCSHSTRCCICLLRSSECPTWLLLHKTRGPSSPCSRIQIRCARRKTRWYELCKNARVSGERYRPPRRSGPLSDHSRPADCITRPTRHQTGRTSLTSSSRTRHWQRKHLLLSTASLSARSTIHAP